LFRQLLDIANHLGVLIKSFPNAGRSDAAVPAECWWKDVGAQHQPSAVEAAYRQLGRTAMAA
jgi:hypothetical protein